MSRPFLRRKAITRASTIQSPDGPELQAHRYSLCFLSRHEDPSANHPATPERRISISHTLTDAPRPITFIRLPLSRLFYHGAPVPATSPPACQRCGQPCTQQIVSEGNRNGNAGRPYYACISGRHRRTFTTWDDSQGIVNGNPRCWCGFTSRRVTTNGPAPTDFYSCAAGGCGYFKDTPEANGIVIVAGTPPYVKPRPEVDMEAQAVGMRPAHRGRRHCCCVLM